MKNLHASTPSVHLSVLALGTLLALGCGAGKLDASSGFPERPPTNPPGNPPGGPTLPPEPGPGNAQAFLSVVGEKNIVVPMGATVDLTALYVDAEDRPITGAIVQFDIALASNGRVISKRSANVGLNGAAVLSFDVTDIEDVYSVQASAANASPVGWRIAVERQTNIGGIFDVDSELNLTESANGSIGRIVRTLDDLVDDPEDPAQYILHLIAEETDVSIIAADLVAPIINDYILSRAPWLIPELSDIIVEVQSVMGRFGVSSTLSISEGSPIAGNHALDGFFFTIYGRQRVLPFGDMGIAPVQSGLFDVSMLDNGRMILGEHAVQVPYGALVRTLIDTILIPGVDASAHNIEQLLLDLIDCATVGAQVAQYIGYGSANVYGQVCTTGLKAASAYVYHEIADIDCDECGMHVSGEAIAVEDPAQGRISDLVSGTWAGQLELKLSNYTLTPSTATFTATRRF